MYFGLNKFNIEFIAYFCFSFQNKDICLYASVLQHDALKDDRQSYIRYHCYFFCLPAKLFFYIFFLINDNVTKSYSGDILRAIWIFIDQVKQYTVINISE